MIPLQDDSFLPECEHLYLIFQMMAEFDGWIPICRLTERICDFNCPL